jgi:hypothetical protein
VQRPGRAIGQHRHPAPADPLGLGYLDRDAGQDLLARGPAVSAVPARPRR